MHCVHFWLWLAIAVVGVVAAIALFFAWPSKPETLNEGFGR